MKEYNKGQNELLKKKLNYINMLVSNHQFDKALSDLDDLRDEYSDNYLIIYEYGMLYLEKKEFDKALEYFYSIINKNNKQYVIYQVGKVKMLQGDYISAKKYFNTILINDYKNKDYALLELAKIDKYLGDYDECLKKIDMITKENKDLYNAAIVEKAYTLYHLKKFDESRDLVKKTMGKIKYRSLLDKCYYILVNIEIDTKNLDDARRYLAKISNKFDKEKLLQAYIEYQQGDYRKCLSICREIQNSELEFNVDSLIAKCYIKSKEPEKGIKILDKLVDEHKELNYILGSAYYNMFEFDKARDALNIPIIENIDNKDACVHKLLMLDIREEKFEDAYEKLNYLIQNDYYASKDLKIEKEQLKVYLSKKLNIEYSKKSNAYTVTQLENYSKDLALNHIMEHLEDQEIAHSIFRDDIDVVKLYDWAAENISKDNFYENSLFDTYIINYPNIGSFKGHVRNYLKIVTIPNTKDIITMFPSDEFGLCNVYEEEEEKVSEIVIESQIDRFNKRFNKTLQFKKGNK